MKFLTRMRVAFAFAMLADGILALTIFVFWQESFSVLKLYLYSWHFMGPAIVVFYFLVPWIVRRDGR